MLDKRVRIPMLVGIGLYGFAIILSILCSFNTQRILPIFRNLDYEGNIFPISIISTVVLLVLYIAFYAIMISSNGKNNRVIGVIMLVAYALPCVGSIFTTYLWASIAARKGAEYLAAYSSINTAITIVTNPFISVASILILVAIGRFGIIGDIKTSEEKSDEEIIYFGGET